MNIEELKQIGEGLTDDEKNSLIVEAVKAKLAEHEKKIRDEYDAKYDSALERMAEAGQNFLEDNVEEALKGVHAEAQALKEQKAAFQKREKELAEDYEKRLSDAETRMKEALLLQQNMMEQNLEKEIREIGKDQSAFTENMEKIHDVMMHTAEKLMSEDVKDKEARAMDIAKLRAETRRRISEIKEEWENADKSNQQKIADAIATLQSFNESVVGTEIKELNEQRMAFEAEKKKIQADYHKIMETVTAIIEEKVAEFDEDYKKLIAERKQLNAQAEKMLIEAKREYIAKAAASGQAFVESAIEKYFEDNKKEIKIAKQNQLGQKMFETVLPLYLASGFAETTDIQELKEQLNEANVELAKAKTVAQTAVEKLDLTEEARKREQKIAEIVEPLPVGQRMMMEKMLASTPTEELDGAFERFYGEVEKLGSNKEILNEKGHKPEVELSDGNRKTTLNEGKNDGTDKYENGSEEGNELVGEILDISKRIAAREGRN